MHIDILTIFPGFFGSPFEASIIKRAVDKGLVTIVLHDLRDYATDKRRSVDDYPYGGGAGMVMMIEPIARALGALQSQRTYDDIIYLTPDGPRLDQRTANHLSTYGNLLLLCGHYKGVDERVRERYITRELSVGDYVLSGGEAAALVLCDAVIRLIPGVLGNETSALSDSFQDGLLSPPVYTRPYEYQGMKVPDILLSGNDKEIAQWRYEKALERTRERRPEMLEE
jgi:tRNA (guanine37-N1)-methyltransferase